MKNWKTTVGGLLFTGGLIAGKTFPQYASFAEAAQAAAVMWLGYHAQDAQPKA